MLEIELSLFLFHSLPHGTRSLRRMLFEWLQYPGFTSFIKLHLGGYLGWVGDLLIA